MPIFDKRYMVDFLDEANACGVDAEGLRKEALALHEGRAAPKLGAGKLSLKALQKAMAQEMGVRSRVLSMLMDAEAALSPLASMREVAIMRAVNADAGELPVPTKTEQRAWLARGLDKRAPILTQLRELKETANYILDDVDKAG